MKIDRSKIGKQNKRKGYYNEKIDMERTKNCLYCGKLLTKKQYWKLQKYCSPKCFCASRRKLKYCANCKKILTIKQRKNKFCSKECRKEWADKYQEGMMIPRSSRERIGRLNSLNPRKANP
ncbi:unnamed protein product, partial [marine sediment metagenome]